MNDAQLKMILDALTSMGVEGKTAFIWWLVSDKVVPAMAWIAIVMIVAFVVRFAIRTLGPQPPACADKLSRNQTAFEAVREAWLRDNGPDRVKQYSFYEAAKKHYGELGVDV